MGWQELGANPRPPLRVPEGGVKLGKQIALKANFFPVIIRKSKLALLHYDVDMKEMKDEEEIKEVRLPKKKRMAILEKLKSEHQEFHNKILAFDSEKNAYSVENAAPGIGGKGKIYKVDYAECGSKPTKYQVTIKVVNRATLQTLCNALKAGPGERDLPLNVMQMLEILMQHRPSIRYEKIGRSSFYSLSGEFGPSLDIGGGKEGMVGFFQSLRPLGWKSDALLLNIDVSNAAFYKPQGVIDLMTKDLRILEKELYNPLSERQRIQLKKELRNLKVQVTHGVTRTYRVQDVSPVGSDRQFFNLKIDEKTTVKCSVQEYFIKQYGMKLKYPKLNCLKVGPVNRDIYLPIEVCKIAKGQKVVKKLSDRQTAEFIRGTAKKPYERLNYIRNIVKNQSFSSDPILKALEFTISDQPVDVDGRILPPPSLCMDKEIQPKGGVWDPRHHTFYSASELRDWAVFNYDRYLHDEKLWGFLKSLRNMGIDRGMKIEKPVVLPCRCLNVSNPKEDFLKIKRSNPDIQLIMVVLSNRSDLYASVKKVGDHEIKVVTQCVQSKNVANNNPATVSNILLKINAKLGGTNNILERTHIPDVLKKVTMVMGADVNHPSANDKVTPSLAAVVASIDPNAWKYASEVRHQKHRKEIIEDLKDMTKNLLLSFYKATKRKPVQIVMYRDGVSESQFLEVLSYELRAMRQACKELGENYEPGITFLVVQKRHHTRLFCQPNMGVGRANNIPPGTTVDSQITHPTERDFYLCSHQGLQGTSRPTHYHVLWDDNNLPMETLKTLTYAMCHLYSRCTRSVSIPTPAYYAHLVAFRAKVHFSELYQSDAASQSSGDSVTFPEDVVTNAVRMDCKNKISSELYFV